MKHKPHCETVILAENATNRWWPECDCGAVDPNKMNLYDSNHGITEYRRKTVDEELGIDMCGVCGSEDHWEDDCNEYECEYTVRDFMSRLEDFLEGELDDISRGNVFLAENGEGTSLNILIGAPFADHADETLNQINVIIAPTDRTHLGAEGLTIHDSEDVERESDVDVSSMGEQGIPTNDIEEDDEGSPFDDAMSILND